MKTLVLSPNTPLFEVREETRRHAEEGCECPVCKRLVKIYHRPLNAGMAYALLYFWRQVGIEWAYKPDVLRGVGAAARDEACLRYWGLFDEHPTMNEPKKRRGGWWRVTDKGVRFIKNEIRVPKYARVYDARCYGFKGPEISIVDALGEGFDYKELMSQ